MSKKKAGYCVYHFAHHGIGRQIKKTDNMEKTRKELEKDEDNSRIVCDEDEKKAIQKYNNLILKNREKNKKQREKKKIKEIKRTKKNLKKNKKKTKKSNNKTSKVKK